MLSEDQIKNRDVPLVFGYGGGVNSMAGLITLRDHDIVPDLVSFADTGDEKPETYDYMLDVAEQWLKENGFPSITTVKKQSPRTGDNSLEEECLRRETLPSRAFGMSSCAMRWKIEPQEKFLNNWKPAMDSWGAGKKPVKVLGIDDGESHRAIIVEDKKLLYWYPLVYYGLDREDCVSLIQRNGLKVPVKSACFYCPSSKKSEVLSLKNNHPDLCARALRMEEVALSSTRHNLRNVKGLGRHWSWRDLLDSSEEDLVKYDETPVESCMSCQD